MRRAGAAVVRDERDGDGDEGSKCNENEAAVVKNLIEELVSPFYPSPL